MRVDGKFEGEIDGKSAALCAEKPPCGRTPDAAGRRAIRDFGHPGGRPARSSPLDAANRLPGASWQAPTPHVPGAASLCSWSLCDWLDANPETRGVGAAFGLVGRPCHDAPGLRPPLHHRAVGGPKSAGADFGLRLPPKRLPATRWGGCAYRGSPWRTRPGRASAGRLPPFACEWFRRWRSRPPRIDACGRPPSSRRAALGAQCLHRSASPASPAPLRRPWRSWAGCPCGHSRKRCA